MKKIRVLLIEDNQADARIIRAMLTDWADSSFVLENVTTLAQSIETLKKNQTDIVICDLGLPDSHGLQTFTALHSQFSHIPIIIYTATDNESMAIEAVQNGAQDYLVKGHIDANNLRQSLRYAIERKHVEEALRTSRQQYRSIINSSPDAFLIFDVDGKIVDVNPAATAMYGYTHQEMIGLPWQNITADDFEKLTAYCKPKIDAGQNVTVESFGLRKDGTTFNNESHVTPFLYNGSPHILAIVYNTAERKQAQARLQAQTELLNSVITHIPHFVFWKNKDSVYLGCNDSFAKIVGLKSPEGVVGKTDYDLVWKKEQADLYRQCDKKIILENKPLLGYEEAYTQNDGRETTMLTSKVPLCDQNGNVVGLLGMFADITDRKKAEEMLKESQERYKRITDSVTDYIFTVAFENGHPVKTVHAGTSVAVTGYTPEEFDADPQLWIKMVYPKDRDLVIEQAKKCTEGKPVESLEHRIIRKDGSIRWVKNTLVRQYDLNGKLLSYDGLIQDIDERKKAEIELRKQRDTAQNYFDIAGVMLIAINTDQHVTAINKRGCEIIGYQEKELIGKNWFDICVPEHYRQTTKEKFCKFISEHNESMSHENYVLTKDGREKLISWNNRVIKDENGTVIGTLSSGEDVTERRRVEEELKRSKEQAEEARSQIEQVNLQLKETYHELMATSRQAGMAEVATDVLHNVGNVLNSVNVLATCIEEKVMRSEIPNLEKISDMIQQNIGNLPKFLAEDSRGKHIPAYLADVAKHMNDQHVEIIEKLCALTKNINHIKQIVKMQQLYSKVSGVEIVTNIDDIIEDAIQINNQGILKRNIEIVRDYEDLGLISIDKQRVLQIMVNLITNAEHALDVCQNNEKRIIIRVYRSGEQMFDIEVTDNGIGIAKENLTKIFRHGFTTKQHGNGFGLHSGALAAKEMGGVLTGKSPGPNKGATFTLTLPLKQLEHTK